MLSGHWIWRPIIQPAPKFVETSLTLSSTVIRSSTLRRRWQCTSFSFGRRHKNYDIFCIFSYILVALERLITFFSRKPDFQPKGSRHVLVQTCGVFSFFCVQGKRSLWMDPKLYVSRYSETCRQVTVTFSVKYDASTVAVDSKTINFGSNMWVVHAIFSHLTAWSVYPFPVAVLLPYVRVGCSVPYKLHTRTLFALYPHPMWRSLMLKFGNKAHTHTHTPFV